MTKPNSQASFKRNAPYNDLPSLPPCVEIETKAVLKGMHCGNAGSS